MVNYKNYTNKEMQAITIAKEITDGQIVIVGTGLPLIGASLAKRIFAPNCKLIVEVDLWTAVQLKYQEVLEITD